ncbi:MAG: uncharacterized protein A8A55_1914 [Amphiamblys sp. WSBS2006]|nr:MAG: uncharacterized protein A8A55_1914 [Amphiamblys sp. WSBS2006]
MEDGSIFVGKAGEIILGDYAVNILPKLRFHEDNELLRLTLYADQEKYVTTILRMEDGSFFVGKAKEIVLENYAVNILPKLKFHEYNELLRLILSADLREHLGPILGTENGSISARNPKAIALRDYTVNILPKLRFHEDNELLRLILSADQEEHITTISDMDDGSIFVGKKMRIFLDKYAVNILPKLRFHERNELLCLILSADLREHLGPILERRQTFCPGEMKEMALKEYAIFILAKMDMTEGKYPSSLKLSMGSSPSLEILRAGENIFLGDLEHVVFEGYALDLLTKIITREEEYKGIGILCLRAAETAHITRTLEEADKRIDIGEVNRMELYCYAVNVLPKLNIGKDNEMESIFMWIYDKKSMADILGMGDESIEIGRIKQSGLWVPEEIKPKLKYIFIDKTKREIMEERARERKREIMEERAREIAKERKREIMEERAREIAKEKTREIAKEETEEKTKKGSLPSRVLKKIFGRGRS